MSLEQKIAAEFNGGHLLVVAGPGTGKTTTLVGRYAFLKSKAVAPPEILCCTFSRRAADEIKDRIEQVMPLNTKSLPIGTFHAIALQVLRTIGSNIGVATDFEIWTKNYERTAIIDALKVEVKKEGFYKKISDDDAETSAILEYIDGMREAMLDPDAAFLKALEEDDKPSIAHSEVYARYEAYLNVEQKIDFPRMVQLACKALEKDRQDKGVYYKKFKHVLVDEYQDINQAQKTLVDQFVAGGAHVWAVGDDKQAIYAWRGSDIKFIQDFEHDFPGAQIVALRENYRSAKNIVLMANNLASNMERVKPVDLLSTQETAGEIYLMGPETEFDEAVTVVEEIKKRIKKGVILNDIAVLARTNKRPIKIASLLIRAGIPVDLKGGVSAFKEYEARLLLTSLARSVGYQLPREISVQLSKDLYSFTMRLLESSTETWEKKVRSLTTYISNRPPQSLADEEKENRVRVLNSYRDYFLSSEEPSSLFSIIVSSFSDNNEIGKVYVGTIHSAKGLEWDSVFSLGWEDGHLPQRRDAKAGDISEERRLAYVAITRAKTFLYQTSVMRSEKDEKVQSPFIDEMWDPIENVASEKLKTGSASAPTRNFNQNSDFKELSAKQLAERKIKIQETWKKANEKRQKELDSISQNLADGSGDGTGWSSEIDYRGFLSSIGYSVKEFGPSDRRRHGILAKALDGSFELPVTLIQSVKDAWGDPNSAQRLAKIRNTINVALGQMKGRRNPSIQAIEKWESDLAYIDSELVPVLNR